MKRQVKFPAASFVFLTMLLCGSPSSAQTMNHNPSSGTPTAERQMQERQKNLQIVSQLKNAGDNCLTKRPITHYFYGPESSILKVAELLGPTATTRQNPSTGALILTEVMACNLDDITKRTLELQEIAEANGCEYDGWESPVQRTTN
ncbi:MAG: ribonuclease E inhibitor RraB [Bosea sp. (in: a-proteobacteria)]